MPAAGNGFGQCRLGIRDVVWHHDKVAFRHSEVIRKPTFARRHGDDLPVRAKIVPARLAGLTNPTSDQRVDGHPFSFKRARYNGSGNFMSKNERCRAAFIMAKKGMHVGATDAGVGHLDKGFACRRGRISNIPVSLRFRACVDKGFHFAVKPPSTIRTWPVTYRDASEHRKRIGPSMSSSAPLRPIQVWAALRCARSSDRRRRPPSVRLGKSPGQLHLP